MKNLRILNKPKETHEDFEINEVVGYRLKEKLRNKQFDFFIKKCCYTCAGESFESFNIFYHKWDELQLYKMQYFMLKCKNKEVEIRLKKINYDKIITKLNHITLIARYDVIKSYEQLKENEKLENIK
jgi:hypothetical protein